MYWPHRRAFLDSGNSTITGSNVTDIKLLLLCLTKYNISRYDKTENLKPGSPELRMITHFIVDAKNKHAYNLRPYVDTHEILAHVDGFSHIRSSYNHFPPIRIKSKPCLFILKNKNPPEEPDFSFTLRKHPAVEEVHEESPVELDFEFSNHFESDVSLTNATEAPTLIEIPKE